jgi:arginine/lysine/ornithine decarboxylase
MPKTAPPTRGRYAPRVEAPRAKSVQSVSPAPFVLDKNVKTEWAEAEKSVGKICAGACGLFPPCTPLIYAGEKITEEKIKLLLQANHRFGLVDGKISVVKDGKDNANENG